MNISQKLVLASASIIIEIYTGATTDTNKFPNIVYVVVRTGFAPNIDATTVTEDATGHNTHINPP
ncbi:MAG: hypothetical protein K2N91_08430 [Muribaculaceae bacterium]|nr:hypothetical protein [Muribaculaceae bacterium]